MSGTHEVADYSIAAVSKLTGASCHALRVWERRYGFPVPSRSASGHRRFSREQVRALQEITRLAQAGRPIGELIADYRLGRLAPGEQSSTPEVAEEGAEASVAGLVDCLIAGDLRASEDGYAALTAGLGPVEIVSRVISPAWIDAGERWFRREGAVYQERIVSQFLQRKLEVMIDATSRSNRDCTRTILIGTVQGDRHVGGVLMLSLSLEWAGWRVMNLGVDLPIREYQGAVNYWQPEALALSFVLSRNIKKRFQELSQIRGMPIFVGGRSILNYQSLARRHGLIPLPGPITLAVPQLMSEYEQWVAVNKPRSAD